MSSKSNSGQSAVHMAAMMGHVRVLHFLLNELTPPMVRRHNAFRSACSSIVAFNLGTPGIRQSPNRIALCVLQDPNVGDHRGWTPLHFAASQSKESVVHYLVGISKVQSPPAAPRQPRLMLLLCRLCRRLR